MHRERYRVRYADIDSYRHVNNKSFISFVEDARTRYLDAATGFSHHGDPAFGVMIVHFEINYRNQIMYEDEVTVETTCSRIGSKSITLEHRLSVEDRPVADARSVLVTYNGETQSTIPVPDTFAEKIRTFEGTDELRHS